MKTEFFYVQPTSWTPTEPFFAIKNKKRLIPCAYQSDAKNGKYEAFIYGEGWKKSKNAVKVPLPNGDLGKYLNEYGEYCLFYAITGKERHSNDCVVWAANQEFSVALNVGIDYNSKFVSEVKALNVLIQKIVMDKYGVDILCEKYQWTNQEPKQLIGDNDLFMVKPHYSLMAYFLCAPHIDPVSDDDKMWKHFVKLEGIENKDKFPVSVSDRLTYLFSKEVSNEYERIMKNYPLNFNPKEK